MRRMLGAVAILAAVIAALALVVRLAQPRLAFFPFAGEDVTPADFGVPFTAHTIETGDGERLRAWHLPVPTPQAQVIYFHGNGGNLSLWCDVLVGLRQRGLEVVAVDYRGYGLSTGAPSEQGLYRDAEATTAYVAARLRRAEVPLVYWGRSLGAAVAAHAAARQPPDGIVLEAGFPDVRSIVASNLLMRALALFATYRFATAESMASVRAPALVIHGDRDRVIPYRLGQRLYEALPGPKRFVTVPGGDHNDPVPADAPLYWEAVREFIAALRSQTSGTPPT